MQSIASDKHDGVRALDVLGPTVELLTDPEERGAVYCVIKGVIPPGVSIPLHSHADPESFFVVSGTAQVLFGEDNHLQWTNVAPGDFFHIPAGMKHAHRNLSAAPVVEILTTTPRIGRFFQEVGRSITPGRPPRRPTREEIERFQQAAAKYGHWLASPAENAAFGITVG
jgi:quercetin dioxygenase-like cupin family protein